ncbi:hypothetical protein B9479_002127 [Cryptococcus floricola]|uniref:Uncharacterized protein n=1 Tax=Cryptococcus floricola TaxID=2591691 RepID=A0A5D3B2B9_9TREE|nr:hypothetical protein B9479_002127 [Cryptococcus floricola]
MAGLVNGPSDFLPSNYVSFSQPPQASTPSISSILSKRFKDARDSAYNGTRNWIGGKLASAADSIIPEPIYPWGANATPPTHTGGFTGQASPLISSTGQDPRSVSMREPLPTPTVTSTPGTTASSWMSSIPSFPAESGAGKKFRHLRTPDGHCLFEVDATDLLQSGTHITRPVCFLSKGETGPSASLTISEDPDGILCFDINKKVAPSSIRSKPQGILKKPPGLNADTTAPESQSDVDQDMLLTGSETQSSSAGSVAPVSVFREPSLLDLSSRSSVFYNGPLKVSGGRPTPGDDGKRVAPDMSIHDWCTSTNGLLGLDKPLTAFSNVASFIQDRYRRTDGSRVLDRDDANQLAPFILQDKRNDGTKEGRDFVALGLDDMVINDVLPTKEEFSSSQEQVQVHAFDIPTNEEAASRIDVSDWEGHSLDEWLTERVKHEHSSDWRATDGYVLSAGEEMLADVRSLGDQMSRRHDLDPDLTTYFSTRIGTYMVDQMLLSGEREVTPEFLHDADFNLFKAKNALMTMSPGERKAIFHRLTTFLEELVAAPGFVAFLFWLTGLSPRAGQ